MYDIVHHKYNKNSSYIFTSYSNIILLTLNSGYYYPNGFMCLTFLSRFLKNMVFYFQFPQNTKCCFTVLKFLIQTSNNTLV